MRVLMFGWEFPPHIAGGLGTACYGLTRGLAKQDVEVTFVMPRASGDEDQRYVKVVSASDVETPFGRSIYDDMEEEDIREGNIEDVSVEGVSVAGASRRSVDKLTFIHINSNLVPYISPEEYETEREIFLSKKATLKAKGRARKVVSGETGESTGGSTDDDVWKQRYTFSGEYGANLMEEVARYAMVAAEVARSMEGQFDVIHAHDWLTYYAGIAAKNVSGKPLVVHIHATEFDRSGENVNQPVYNIERAGLLAADKVIAVSNLTRNTVIQKYGVSADKVVTVHNAVHFSNKDEVDVERGVDDKIITFLGRITYQKGPEYFVEAAAKVLKVVPNVRFVMAGSGDMMNQIVRRVAKLGISDRFHFTGFLKGDDVQKMYALSDVYVMPSVSEPFGISPLEAMRSHVPVIISRQSGVAEVLDYAIKINYWDIDAMADAMYGLIQYPALGKVFSSKGLEEVSSMKWSDAALKLKEVYQSLIPPEQRVEKK